MSNMVQDEESFLTWREDLRGKSLMQVYIACLNSRLIDCMLSCNDTHVENKGEALAVALSGRNRIVSFFDP